ncbi:MAG: hypothetical protein ACFFE5_11610 [Candidatus Thorarchaeota archaeon]
MGPYYVVACKLHPVFGTPSEKNRRSICRTGRKTGFPRVTETNCKNRHLYGIDMCIELTKLLKHFDANFFFVTIIIKNFQVK